MPLPLRCGGTASGANEKSFGFRQELAASKTGKAVNRSTFRKARPRGQARELRRNSRKMPSALDYTPRVSGPGGWRGSMCDGSPDLPPRGVPERTEPRVAARRAPYTG